MHNDPQWIASSVFYIAANGYVFIIKYKQSDLNSLFICALNKLRLPRSIIELQLYELKGNIRYYTTRCVHLDV